MACFWTDVVFATQQCPPTPSGALPPPFYSAGANNGALNLFAMRELHADVGGSQGVGGVYDGNLYVPVFGGWFPQQPTDFLRLTSIVVVRRPRFLQQGDISSAPEIVEVLGAQDFPWDTPWEPNGLLGDRFKGPFAGLPAMDPAYAYSIDAAYAVMDEEENVLATGDLYWMGVWDESVDGADLLATEAKVMDVDGGDPIDVFFIGCPTTYSLLDDEGNCALYQGLGYAGPGGGCSDFQATVDGHEVTVFASCA